jgi:putative ABC transport system permease protein
MRASLLLARRTLVGERWRALLAVLTIAAGIAVGAAVVIEANTISSSYRRFQSQFAGVADIRVLGPTRRGGIPPETMQAVRATEGVGAAAGLVHTVTEVRTPTGRIPVLALGVDCEIERFVGPFGCSPEAVASSADVRPAQPILSATLAQVQQPAVLLTDDGPIPLDSPFGAAELEGVNDGRVVAFGLPAAQRVFGRGGIDEIFVRADKRAGSLAVLQERLEAALPPGIEVLRRGQVPRGAALGGPVVPLLGFIALLAIGVGGIVVANVVSLSVARRRRELAVVAALGSRPATLVGSVAGQFAALGAVGGAAGVAAGWLLAHPLVESISNQTLRTAGVSLTLQFPLWLLPAGVAAGALVALVAAAAPARRATTLDVIGELHGDSVRDDGNANSMLRRRAAWVLVGILSVDATRVAVSGDPARSWSGIVAPPFLLVGTVALLVGLSGLTPALVKPLRALQFKRVPMQLPIANMVMDPRRSATAVVSIAASVGLAVVLGSLGQAVVDGASEAAGTEGGGGLWVSRVRPTETTTASARLSPALVDRLRKVAGVSEVNPEFAARLTTARGRLAVLATEGRGRSYPKVAGNLPSDLQGEDAIVGTSIARRWGVLPGDSLVLPGVKGEVRLRVVGIWRNPSSNGANVTVSSALFREGWRDIGAVAANVVPTAGTDSAELSQRLVAAMGTPDARALTPDRLAAAFAADIRQQVAPFWALQRALLLVALIATASTMILLALQRQRERGVLAAVGLSSAGFTGMAVVEAAVLAVLGALTGAIAAVGIFSALRDNSGLLLGVSPPFRYDLPAALTYSAAATVIVCGGALLISFLGGKTDARTALAYE